MKTQVMEDKPDWWVKATDRLPQHRVKHHLKIYKDAILYSGYYDHSLKRFMCPNFGPQGVKINEVQWLDENVIASLQSELSSAQEKNRKLLEALKDICTTHTIWTLSENIEKGIVLISEIENKKV
jgi:hypothetical protein